MATSTSHLYFMVFLFWGGCLVLQPCEANHCTLEEVKECLKTLVTFRRELSLAHLIPPRSCPQTEITCLENLDNCTDITNMIDIFRYYCNATTGVMDTTAVNLCLNQTVKGSEFGVAATRCTMESEWADTLTGQGRCSAATTFATCIRTVVDSLCTGEAITRFFNKHVELSESYGCFKVEKPTMEPNQGGIMMLNQGMMTVTLGLTLMTLLFK